MSKNRHTKDDLRQLQGLPLKLKVRMTEERIREWVREYGEDGVSVSFSGGKDSTVLLFLARRLYPGIKATFFNTGIEYPEIIKFVETFSNVDLLKPNIPFVEIIKKYGYPMISKEVAECVAGARKYLTALAEQNSLNQSINQSINQSQKWHYQKYRQICGLGEYDKHYGKKLDNSPNSQEFLAQTVRFTQNSTTNQLILRAIQNANGKTPKEDGSVPWRFAAVLGVLARDNTVDLELLQNGKTAKRSTNSNSNRSAYSCERYQFFLDAPFKINSICCRLLKKSLSHKYESDTGRKPITAQMASESRLRTQQWLANGCNGFCMKRPISNPMSPWFEQDVLAFIRAHREEMIEWRRNEFKDKHGCFPEELCENPFTITSPIASVYGDVVTDDEEFGQMNIFDLMQTEIFDLDRPTYHTTGCDRTKCITCGFGIHHEDCPEKSRLQNTIKLSNPKIVDWMLRGGHFRESDGMWEPHQGLGLAFVYEWINQHGGFNIWFPDKEKYLSKLPEECWRYLHK